MEPILVADLKKTIREIPDFPKPGINFYDVSTLFRNAAAFRATVDTMVARFQGEAIDAITSHRISLGPGSVRG